ncbi:zf-HC2 domain-containing protein [Candidatus Poribacteria bacterium]|nr:zf-HC2 domain-containing protein [Candidatus Poribacteria bacterium]
MKCNDVREELIAYIDGELSSMGMRTIEAHLAGCPECTTEWERLRKMTGWIHQMESIPPSPDWWQKLEARLHQLDAEPSLLSEIRALREAITRIESRISQRLNPIAPVKEIMTLDEAAAYLQVDSDTVWNLLDEIPHFQVGYELRFRKSSVDEWIRMKENGSQREAFYWDMPMNWMERVTQLGQ